MFLGHLFSEPDGCLYHARHAGVRQTATPGFMALCLPPKKGVFQGINDWELSRKAIKL